VYYISLFISDNFSVEHFYKILYFKTINSGAFSSFIMGREGEGERESDYAKIANHYSTNGFGSFCAHCSKQKELSEYSQSLGQKNRH
jgi:hypothetical protein